MADNELSREELERWLALQRKGKNRSMRDRARQLLALEKRGVYDLEKQARRMGLSIGHVSRIRGWIREHGIGDEERINRIPLEPPAPEGSIDALLQNTRRYRELRRQSSDYSDLPVRLPRDLVERLRAYCEKKDVTVESAVTIALEHYLKTRPR